MPVLYDFTIAASVFRAKYHWCKVEWPNASIFKKDNNMPNPIIFTKKSIVLIKTYKTKKMVDFVSRKYFFLGKNE